ncbi:MAG: hypothetical protein WA131_02295 [Desulfitobacteriaceae bacterium]
MSKYNRTYLLYVAIAMIGFVFIVFMSFDRSAASYLLVNTLKMEACGIILNFFGGFYHSDFLPASSQATFIKKNI